MAIQNNREWWKVKVYNEVSAYLRYPNFDRKQQLQSILIEYEKIFRQSGDIENNQFSDLEITMNGR